nr:hypothetical protein OG409_01680 [Streptomyces sp. NBC_00974]
MVSSLVPGPPQRQCPPQVEPPALLVPVGQQPRHFLPHVARAQTTKAAQEAVRALSGGAGREWTPEQEGQIRALAAQVRRPGSTWST